MSVDDALSRYAEAVASVGVDKRRVVDAGLSFDARLSHRIVPFVVRAEKNSPLLEVQIHARPEEQRSGSMHARLHDERPAALRGKLVDALLQSLRLGQPAG